LKHGKQHADQSSIADAGAIVDCTDPLGPFETANDLERFKEHMDASQTGPFVWPTLKWSVLDCAPACPPPTPGELSVELEELRNSEMWMAHVRNKQNKGVLLIVGQVRRGRKIRFPPA
jgi:hypothetical protein